MNAGFSSLAWLKARLLLASDVAGTANDDAVAALGLGMASMCEDFCGRKFGREVNATHLVRGDRLFLVVPRYPLESVSAVEARTSTAGSWSAVDASAWNWQEDAGLITLLYPQTSHMGSLRVTYTGGYWWDTTEDDSGTQPAGSYALPEAIRQAWATACKTWWDRSSLENAAKAGFGGEEAGRILDQNFDLPSIVKMTLARYRTMA